MSAAKACHTHFTRGTMLRIGLRDGSVIVSRFRDRLSKWIEVEDDEGRRQKIPTKLLRSVSKLDRSRQPI